MKRDCGDCALFPGKGGRPCRHEAEPRRRNVWARDAACKNFKDNRGGL